MRRIDRGATERAGYENDLRRESSFEIPCTVEVRYHWHRAIGRGEALGAMLEHVLAEWRVDDVKVLRRHAIFARDRWRCVVPGCTSMRNLQDHHIVFRSADGSDEPENRVTLCAWHHLRGVHAGIVRITGRQLLESGRA